MTAVADNTSTTTSRASEVSVITMPSPIGELTVAASDLGVRFVMWEADHRFHPGAGGGASPPARLGLLAEAVSQLEEYFRGDRTDFDVPLDPQGTPFQHTAWLALRQIPYGSTISYGEQARSLGDPNKARAVGAANGRNPIGIIVPCHRVVGSNGSLTGFAGGLGAKAWLLDHERQMVAAR